MTDLKYGPDARHRLCAHCGEAFGVDVDGGEVTCPACGAPASLKPRDLEPLAEPAASPNVGMLVATIICFVLGLVGIGVGVYFLGPYEKEWAYKKTQGTVVNVNSRGAGSGSNSSIRVYVQYRYQVDSKHYSGRLVETDKPYFSYDTDSAAAHQIRMLKRNKTVTVYYDPKHPEKAILVRQNAALHAVPFTVTGMVWVMALIFFVLYWKKRRVFKKKMEEAAKAEAEEAVGSGA